MGMEQLIAAVEANKHRFFGNGLDNIESALEQLSLLSGLLDGRNDIECICVRELVTQLNSTAMVLSVGLYQTKAEINVMSQELNKRPKRAVAPHSA